MRYLIDARPLVDPIQGGVSRVARGVVEAFVEISKEDEIIFATTGAKSASIGAGLSRHPLFPHPARENIIHLNCPNKIWSAACMAGLTSLDRAVEKRVGKTDAVFLPNIGFVGSMKRPYVLLLHDLSFLIEPRWFSLKSRLWHKAIHAKRCIRNAAHLLSVSETTKRDAMRMLNIPEERITVIPIGFSLPSHATRYSLDRGGRDKPAPTQSRYALALGGNDPRKNSMTAVRAVEILRRDPVYADLRLIIVGRDIFHQSDSELISLYSNASAFLYPSWYEGYGLPLHEAAACGTPRVASTAGALPETAPLCTIFADPAKPHHWAEAIKTALSVPRPAAIAPDPDAWNRAAAILSKTLDFIAK